MGNGGLMAMLHLSSRSILVRGLHVAMQDSKGGPLPCLWGHCASGTGPQLLGWDRKIENALLLRCAVV
jgi:hypothetical protein